MKLTALTALGICFALAGQYMAHRLDMRVKLIEKLKVMLYITESEIEYLRRPSYELIAELSHNSELDELTFLKVCEERMKNGSDFRAAWEAAVNDRSNTRYFANEDVQILHSFGTLFGVSDSGGQISNCRLHSELLSSNLGKAEQSRDKYSALCRGMGLTAGVGLIIIFI